MGTKERKERERKERKENIINIAEKVFFEDGYVNANMDKIANEVELSKGTLYLYFSNKEELYYNVIKKCATILLNAFSEAFNKGKNGLEKTMNIGKAYFDFAWKESERFNAILHCSLDAAEKAEGEEYKIETVKELNKNVEILIEAIKIGQNDGSIDKNLDPVLTALMLWGSATGTIEIMAYEISGIEKTFGKTKEQLYEYFFTFLRRAMNINYFGDIDETNN